MSAFTSSESTRACMRKSFAVIICSRSSHRLVLSDVNPVICTCTSSSISEIVMTSLPTTATVLSTTPPEYFCAEATKVMAIKTITAAAALIIRRFFISLKNYKLSGFARVFEQILFQSRNQRLLACAYYHIPDGRSAVLDRSKPARIHNLRHICYAHPS